MDGQPTIIVIDEGWKALDDPVFGRQLRDWLKTIRKRNGIVGFCTQSASDALDSTIAAAIVEQTATHIFLPSPKARAADYIEGFGLTSHEYDLVRLLPDTSRCFLIKQSGQSAVARLDLSDIGGRLAVLAGNERSIRRLDRIEPSWATIRPSGCRRSFRKEAGADEFLSRRPSHVGIISSVLTSVDCNVRNFSRIGTWP